MTCSKALGNLGMSHKEQKMTVRFPFIFTRTLKPKFTSVFAGLPSLSRRKSKWVFEEEQGQCHGITRKKI